MKKFKDQKISSKITSSILMIVLVSNLIIGIIGMIGITVVSNTAKQVYKNNLMPLTPIFKFSADFYSVRVDMRTLLLSTGDNTATINAIEASFADMNNQLTLYDKQISSAAERSNFNRIQNDTDAYKTLKDNLVKYVSLGQKDKAQALLKGKITADMTTAVNNAFSLNTTQAQQRNQANTTIFFVVLAVIMMFVAASILFAIKFGKYIAANISNPIEKMAKAAESISDGNLDIDISVDSQDETGILAHAFAKIIDSLKRLAADADMLSKAAVEGKLSTRADASRHQGEYRKIVVGVNETLDAVIGPLEVAADYVDRISRGNMPEKIAQTYNGDFNMIKNNLNKCIDAINLLVSDANMLSESAIQGKLSARADASRHQGDFRKIVDGVNHTLDAVTGPLKVAAEYVERISKGNIPEKLTDEYNGDFNMIKNNLNTCIDAIDLLISDAGMLSESAIQGRLSTRADASSHQGDFRKIIDGFNHTLEAIVVPIDEVQNVLGRMAVNDYTVAVSDGYQGDMQKLASSVNSVRGTLLNVLDVFSKISNGDISPLDRYKSIGQRSENDRLMPAAIKMMQSILDLIHESDLLATAALAGDLSFRGDEQKFSGGYRQIIEGINRTMEAVSSPIEESAQVLQKLAQGDLTVEVTGDYKGAYDRIKNSLNHAIDSFNKLLNEINVSAAQVATGSKQVSDGSQSLSQGTTEQASSVEELTSSIAEVASQTKQNAINAAQASELSAEVKNEAARGNSQMQTMLSAMRDINESSSSISKIIKVIDDIAFQTNILALNAAVEAARAGQYGKGFAVVAEEVRNLAAKSADAAKETTTLIEGSFSKVEAGAKIANETAQELGTIAQKAEKSAELVSKIATSSNEQASAITQVDKGLDQVSTVVQANAATAEESAASSEELSGQADMLNQMVSKFKLKGAGSASADVKDKAMNDSHAKLRAASEPEGNPPMPLTAQFGKY